MNQSFDPPVRVDCPQCRFPMTLSPEALKGKVTCDNCLEEFTPKPVESRKRAKRPAASPSQRNLNKGDRKSSSSDIPPKDAQRLEGDLSKDEYPAQRREVLQSDYEFTLRCPLCSTLQDATDAQIGHVVHCPDCHSKIKIREPSPRRRRPLGKGAEVEDEDELRLSPLEDDSPAKQHVPMIPVEVTEEPKAFVSPGQDALRKAEAASEKQEQEEKRLPTRPLISGSDVSI